MSNETTVIVVIGSVTAKQYGFVRLECLRAGLKKPRIKHLSIRQLEALDAEFEKFIDELEESASPAVDTFFGGMGKEEIIDWFLHDQTPQLADAAIMVHKSSEVHQVSRALWDAIADIVVDLDRMDDVKCDFVQNLQGYARHSRGEYPIVERLL